MAKTLRIVPRWNLHGPDILYTAAAAAGAAAVCHVLWRAADLHGGGRANTLLEVGLLLLVAALVAALSLQRVRSEMALRDRQALVQAILDQAPEAIFVKRRDGRYVLANRAAARLFGVPADGIVGAKDATLFPASIAARLEHRDDAAMTGDAPLTAEDTIPTVAGDPRILLSTRSAWRDTSGDVAGLIGIAVDITARKQAEEEHARLLALEREARAAAEAAERRFLELVDGVDAIVWEADADTMRFTFVSRRADELLGWPMAQWLEDRDFWSRFLHPDDRERVLAARRCTADTGVGGDSEYRVRTVEGETRWFRDLVHTVRDDHGLVRQLRGVMFDITARRRVEEQLRESEARFRLLADSAPVLIWIAGPDGGCTWFNRQWLDFTGRTMAEDLGEGWTDAIHPDDVQDCRRAYYAAVGARRPFELEYRMRRHDGAWRWILDIGTPRFDEGGGFAGYLGSALDITERRTMEQELRVQRELAQQASRAKDEFLATVSHELRTPLAAILGWARLLRSGSLNPPKAARALDTIERAGRAQAQLIDDLLDISRIITGRLRLEPRQVALQQPIEAALEAVRPTGEAKNIRLDVQLGRDPAKVAVAGDPARIQQVVWNLLSNALKFTPEGGHVTLRLERTGRNAVVSVTDTGKGIPLDALPHVFERFWQADGTTTRKHGGLGLGLAIVRYLVEMHGGTVHAHSDGPGRGATFSVTLPALPAGTATVSEVPRLSLAIGPRPERRHVDEPPALRGRRVLVVDDDRDAREVLVAILEGSGASVMAAASVPEAIDVFRGRGADIVVSDIAMPGEDGFELIRRLRRLDGGTGSATPAVAVTALARGEERRRILDAGFQLHFAKPVEPRELVAAIANLTADR